MPLPWVCAFAVAVLYLVLLATGRKGWLKVLPALLLAASVPRPFAPAFVLCAVGDGCLLSPRLFLAGLGAFFCGHIGFMVAFSRVPDAAVIPPIPLALTLGVAALIMVISIWPGLRGPLRVAVPIYAVGLGGTAYMSARAGWLPAAGGLLFLASDSLLAWNRFRKPFRSAEAAVMITYFGALLLLAKSW